MSPGTLAQADLFLGFPAALNGLCRVDPHLFLEANALTCGPNGARRPAACCSRARNHS